MAVENTVCIQGPSAEKPNAKNLCKGGGRRDKPGWTDHKRRTNRKRFNELRPLIQTGVTIIYPKDATKEQLLAVDRCNQNFASKFHIPARCVWEGPGKHCHIAVGIHHDPDFETIWRRRLENQWKKHFGLPMPPDALLWNPDVEPDKIASYCLKTRKKENGSMVKGEWPWLTFNPVWETGFTWLKLALAEKSQQDSKPRRTKAKASVRLDSPHYTVETTERKTELPTSEHPAVIAELKALSPSPLRGEPFFQCYGLLRALENQMLSLRLDMGGMDIAQKLHRRGELCLVCVPPSVAILHMLIVPEACLPEHLKVRLQPGTAIPRNFEVIYLAA